MSRWSARIVRLFSAALLLCCGTSSEGRAAAAEKFNVLFIAVDDLRPELGCYGKSLVNSPNIDRLAAEGLRFHRAYCQQAICGPSRASLMTGLRPDSAGVIHNEAHFRDKNPEVVTLPQHFRAQGYQTVHVGKIFHPNMVDLEKSWSMTASANWARGSAPYQLAENKQWIAQQRKELEDKWGKPVRGFIAGPVTETADVADDAYLDGRVAAEAVELLRKLKADAGRPFFLGVGFHKPHLPFIAPKRYWDLYDPAQVQLAANPLVPRDMPAMALHDSFELRTYGGSPKSGPIDEQHARHFIHGYLACASYVDAQIGKVLAELGALGLRDRTIVILWGDHGWHLGDHGVWGKATNFEIATRVPLVIRAPGMKAKGQASDALVELVDMYPTLCALAGLPLPPHLEGHSFAPLLDNPSQPWKKAAFSQFPCPALREWAALPLSPKMRQGEFRTLIEEKERQIAAQLPDKWSRERFEQHVMGYAMRTDRYRLVQWVDQREPQQSLALELYDYQDDPLESVNLAVQPKQRPLVQSLLGELRSGWRAALPAAQVRH